MSFSEMSSCTTLFCLQLRLRALYKLDTQTTIFYKSLSLKKLFLYSVYLSPLRQTKNKTQTTKIPHFFKVVGSPNRCDRWVSDSSSRGVFSVVDKIKSGLKVISARPNWLNGVRSFMRLRCHHASGGDCVHCN